MMRTSAAIQRKETRKARDRRTLAMFLVGAGLLLFGAAALLLLPKANWSSNSAESESLYAPAKVNYPAPDLRLNDLEGNKVSLKDYQGKVILVNNWATWCPPCREEMPVLEAFYKDHKEQNFILVGIEAGEPADQVSLFVQSNGITFPVWLDPGNQALRAFRNDALPSSYIIDPQGMVRLAWAGMVNQGLLEKYVTPLLEK